MHLIYQSASALKAALPSDARIVLVGGCFDLLHVGHVRLLEYAATLEPVLVVAVLSDRYIRTYKSSDRPIIPQAQRAEVVASLRCAPFVYISDESPSSRDALSLLAPAHVVFDETDRGSPKMEIRLENIRRASPLTQIAYAPRFNGGTVSTGHIIAKIRREALRPA